MSIAKVYAAINRNGIGVYAVCVKRERQKCDNGRTNQVYTRLCAWQNDERRIQNTYSLTHRDTRVLDSDRDRDDDEREKKKKHTKKENFIVILIIRSEIS